MLSFSEDSVKVEFLLAHLLSNGVGSLKSAFVCKRNAERFYLSSLHSYSRVPPPLILVSGKFYLATFDPFEIEKC